MQNARTRIKIPKPKLFDYASTFLNFSAPFIEQRRHQERKFAVGLSCICSCFGKVSLVIHISFILFSHFVEKRGSYDVVNLFYGEKNNSERIIKYINDIFRPHSNLKNNFCSLLYGDF